MHQKFGVWHSIPRCPLKNSSGFFLGESNHRNGTFRGESENICFPGSYGQLSRNPMTPLLKMKSYIRSLALVEQSCRPIRMHRTRSWTAFPASDHPVNWFKTFAMKPRVQINWSEQWFTRQEADNRFVFQQERQAFLGVLLIFDRRSKPDILRPRVVPRNHVRNILRPLRQQQPIKPRRRPDERPQTLPLQIQFRTPLKNVRHACAKDPVACPLRLRFFIPSERLFPVCVGKKSARS